MLCANREAQKFVSSLFARIFYSILYFDMAALITTHAPADLRFDSPHMAYGPFSCVSH